jgi:hypothetical protein
MSRRRPKYSRHSSSNCHSGDRTSLLPAGFEYDLWHVVKLQIKLIGICKTFVGQNRNFCAGDPVKNRSCDWISALFCRETAAGELFQLDPEGFCHDDGVEVFGIFHYFAVLQAEGSEVIVFVDAAGFDGDLAPELHEDEIGVFRCQ